MKILLIAPKAGNGGIRTWANRFEKAFPQKYPDVSIVRISGTDRRVSNPNVGKFKGAINGILDLIEVCFKVRKLLKTGCFDILHATTSGRAGSLRDILLAKIAHYYGVKSIMHCRYGCIPDVYPQKNIIGWLTRKAIDNEDHVWVLDSPSYHLLSSKSHLRNNIKLTPNSIQVNELNEITPKKYYSVGFVGNVDVSKGVLELTRAVSSLKNTELDIIGPLEKGILPFIKEIAGQEFGKRIKVHGKLPNEEAVKLMEHFDIISLPTYYQGEAFPISILEAMSKGKLVISCPRAAIPDMLTSIDGEKCGILVNEKSYKELAEAIQWAQTHRLEADEMCKKAYKKVYECYREDVVYTLYMKLYKDVLNKG